VGVGEGGEGAPEGEGAPPCRPWTLHDTETHCCSLLVSSKCGSTVPAKDNITEKGDGLKKWMVWGRCWCEIILKIYWKFDRGMQTDHGGCPAYFQFSCLFLTSRCV
jgi:hypothetical protein